MWFPEVSLTESWYTPFLVYVMVGRSLVPMIFALWIKSLSATLYGKRDFAYVIKVTKLLTLRQGDYPVWAQCNHMSPLKQGPFFGCRQKRCSWTATQRFKAWSWLTFAGLRWTGNITRNAGGLKGLREAPGWQQERKQDLICPHPTTRNWDLLISISPYCYFRTSRQELRLTDTLPSALWDPKHKKQSRIPRILTYRSVE